MANILQTLGDVTGFTQHNIDNQLLKNAVDAGRISENQYKTMGGYNVSQTMPQNLGLGYGDVGLASLGYQGMKKFAGGLDKLYDMTGGKIGIEDTMGMSKYGNIGALESIYLNTMGAKKGLDPYNLQTYQSILGQYKPVGGMYPGGKHELMDPQTRFRQHQLMNLRKQDMQQKIRRAEAIEAAKKTRTNIPGTPIVPTGGGGGISNINIQKRNIGMPENLTYTPPRRTVRPRHAPHPHRGGQEQSGGSAQGGGGGPPGGEAGWKGARGGYVDRALRGRSRYL